MFNNMKTFMLLAALTALLIGAGMVMGGKNGLVLGLVFAVAMNFAGYWFSDKIALKMSGAREVSPAEAPELHSMVANLCQRAQLPMPRVYVTPDMQPNAFATGRDPQHAAVAVTQGIMRILDRDELEGVLAHELAHIKNRDILISSVAAMLAGAIAQMANFLQFSFLFGHADEEEGNPLGMVGAIAAMIVAPIAASLVQFSISRAREFEADRVGAQICGRPMALANALLKLERGAMAIPMQNANAGTAHMYIVNPLSMGLIAKLFSTHPPVPERVERLRQMSYGATY